MYKFGVTNVQGRFQRLQEGSRAAITGALICAIREDPEFKEIMQRALELEPTCTALMDETAQIVGDCNPKTELKPSKINVEP